MLGPFAPAFLCHWIVTIQADCWAVTLAMQVVTEALIARALLLMHSGYVLDC